jgi:hypothetical protein
MGHASSRDNSDPGLAGMLQWLDQPSGIGIKGNVGAAPIGIINNGARFILLANMVLAFGCGNLCAIRCPPVGCMI